MFSFDMIMQWSTSGHFHKHIFSSMGCTVALIVRHWGFDSYLALTLIYISYYTMIAKMTNCDCLCINRPFTTKCKFSVQARIVHRTQFVDFAFVIDGIYPLLHTFWQSLVHELCMCSLNTKQLALGLLVNGVRIRKWKRVFLEMYFWTVSHLPSYNLRIVRESFQTIFQKLTSLWR